MTFKDLLEYFVNGEYENTITCTDCVVDIGEQQQSSLSFGKKSCPNKQLVHSHSRVAGRTGGVSWTSPSCSQLLLLYSFLTGLNAAAGTAQLRN